MLKKRININQWNQEGFTPLILAAFNGHLKIVRLLLDNGSKIDMKDIGGDTALISACSAGHEDIVKLLIYNGADVNAIGFDDTTPWLVSVIKNKTNIRLILETNGANTQEKHPWFLATKSFGFNLNNS